MADDDQVQSWLSGLPFKVKRELATVIKREADNLASEIRAAAPRKTGTLASSVQVRRKRNDTELEVTAGGDSTTRELRAGSGVSYDYARAVEFGTVNAAAQPFFFNTYRANAEDIRERIDSAIEEAINKS